MTGAFPDATAQTILSGVAVTQDEAWVSAELDGLTRPSVETLLLRHDGHQAETCTLIRIPGTSHLLTAGAFSRTLPFTRRAGILYHP